MKEYNIPEKVTCRPQYTSPKLRPITDKFIDQLARWIVGLDTAVTEQDFEKIGKFAYWLKASGGSVGFDAFNEPARDLESQAKEKQLDVINHTIGVIKELNSRIAITSPEQDSG